MPRYRVRLEQANTAAVFIEAADDHALDELLINISNEELAAMASNVGWEPGDVDVLGVDEVR